MYIFFTHKVYIETKQELIICHKRFANTLKKSGRHANNQIDTKATSCSN